MATRFNSISARSLATRLTVSALAFGLSMYSAQATVIDPAAAIAASTATSSEPSPLDKDTPECALARAVPTDGNIQDCTGEPI